MVDGFQKANPDDNKYDALIRINTINGVNPELCSHRPNFEKLTPVFPNSRLSMEVEGGSTALRIVCLLYTSLSADSPCAASDAITPVSTSPLPPVAIQMCIRDRVNPMQ